MATKISTSKTAKFNNKKRPAIHTKTNEKIQANVSWFERKWNYFILIFLISLFSSSIYFQSYKYDFTQDDATYTIENSITQKGIKGIKDIFTHGSLNYYIQEPTNSGVYRPITLTSFAVEYAIFKKFDPKYDHIINVILYLLLLVMVGLVLQKLFKRINVPMILPLLILLLYGLHPIHSEVVASIKSRDTLLASFFAFGATFFWLTNKNKPTFIHKILIALLFFLAILSKEEAITFVAVIFLIAYFFKGQSIYKSIKETIPFVISSAIYLVLRFLILDPSTDTYNSILNNVIYSLHGPDRLATNLYVYLYYIKLLFYPFPLSVDYSFSEISPKTFANGWVILSLFFFIFIIGAALKYFSKRHLIVFVILYYLCTFSIFSNFTESITIGSTIGERFMFLPSLGFCIIIVYGLYLLVKRVHYQPKVSILVGILLPICLIYSIKSFSRTQVWKDNIALAESGIVTSPNSWRVHNNLAEASYSRTLRLSGIQNKSQTQIDSLSYWNKRAKEQFESAFEIIKNENARPYYSLMHYGMVLFNLHDTLGAREIFKTATRLSSNLSSAWFNLATISFYEKQYDSSIIYFTHALSGTQPDSFAIYKYLGSSYLMVKNYESSIKFYEQALHYHKDQEIVANLSFLYSTIRKYDNSLKLNTTQTSNNSISANNFENIFNAANIAYANGDYKSAINYLKQCKELLQTNSDKAKLLIIYNLLGQAYLKLNQIDAAKQVYKELVQKDPSSFSALQNLGLFAFKFDKDYDLAIKYFTKCLQSKSPDYFFTYTSLGFLYSIKNRTDEAIDCFENSLKYGSSREILNNLLRLWKIKGNTEMMNKYQALLTNLKD
jgi:protein O-mannosyl-transferase